MRKKGLPMDAWMRLFCSFRLSAALLIAAGLAGSFLMEGCSGSQEKAPRRPSARRLPMDLPPPVDVAEAESPLDLQVPPDSMPDVVQRDLRPAPPPPRRGAMTPEDLIRRLGLGEQARTREAEELVLQARADLANFETARAEERLEEARKLDPGNQEAQRLLAEVRTLVGDRRGTISEVGRRLADERRVHIMQSRAEIRNSINSAQRYVEEREFDRAVEEFEKAIQLTRNFPFNLQLDSELKAAETGLRLALDGRKLQVEEDRQLLMERVNETRRAEMESSVNLVQNRVRELRRKAKDAWDRAQYSEVETITAQILSVLPEGEEAVALNSSAREERHLQTQYRTFLAQVENHDRVMLALDASSIAYQEIFRYPSKKEWARLQPKVITLEERVAAEESSVEKEIKRKLEDLQTVGFPEPTPFGDALRLLTSISGVNFILTRDAQQVVRDEDINVTLPQMRDAPLRSILTLLLTNVVDQNFTFTIESGAVLVGSRDDLRELIKTFREFYDVTDVTQSHPDFPAPRIALEATDTDEGGFGGGLDIGLDDEEAKGSGQIERDKLIELISNEMIDPETDEIIGQDPKFLSGKLMITTTLEIHQKIQRLLTQLRKATGIMVTVESRFLDIQENFLEEIGVDFGSASNTFLPNSIPDIDGAGTGVDPGFEYTNTQQDVNVRIAEISTFSNALGSRVNPFNISSSGGGALQLNSLDNGGVFSFFGDIIGLEKFQEEAILTGVGKEQSVRRLSSPRVTAFNTQVAHTLVVDQAAYIQDLEVNQTGVIPVINPVIGILNSGSILEVRPTVSYDRKYVVLEIQPTLAEQLQPEIAALSLSNNFTVVPIELPVLSLVRIKTTVTIPDGGTVLVGGLKREITTKQSIGIPIIRHIPILNLFFGRTGESKLRSNLYVLINAKITMVHEEEERVFNT